MRAAIFVQGLIGFLIVAFGQPSFSVYLAPIAAFVGYALFFRAIRIFPFKRQRFWRAFLWYGAISLVQLSWMTSIEYQGIYILFVWLSLAIWLGFQFGCLAILIPYQRPLTIARILALSSLWTLIEWSRYHILCGYSWNLSGIALSSSYAIQFASIAGILGLSFWVLFVNLLGLRAMTRKGIVHYGIWFFAAALPYLFGFVHFNYHEKQMRKSDERVGCLLVQTGILPPEKVPIQGKIRSFISPYDQWQRILSLVKESWREDVDLIVLPEAAVPFSCHTPLYSKEEVKRIFLEVFGEVRSEVFPQTNSNKVAHAFWVQTLSNICHCGVVVGLDHVEGNSAYNAAFFAEPFKNDFSRYDKQILMPLAEYLPFKIFAPLVKKYGIDDFFTPGEGARLFQGKVPFATSICYEETFPGKIRLGRLLGAKLFVNVTNDGWYPHSHLPSQHFEHAKFRALENGVPLIRACNTGVSAAVDSLGRVLGRLDERNHEGMIQKGALFVTVSTYTYSTLFSAWGNVGIVLICLIFLGVFIGLKKEFNW